MDAVQLKARIEAQDPANAESVAEGRAREALAAATALSPGDLVIHVAHGLGRFERVARIAAGGTHDVLEIAYRDGRLLVPVEDIGLLSRFGPAQSGARLDRVDGAAWLARKGRAIAKINAIARRLIGIAARRELADAPVLVTDPEQTQRFAAGFPFEPTPDQASAFADVERDLASGKPMDRLVCGDVGSGKTEVALRAAFLAARAGVQVAVICPTTLLARQHTETFRARFADFPVTIETASRLTGSARAAKVRAGIADGTVDIAIGTHALLAKDVGFKRLGLLIIDEEQRFGVQHKERLKQLREGVHVLTLTATPIPRTMQLALSPVRELSLIMTPPVGRRPVETFVGPADPATIGQALIDERRRGGQSFYVCPRIADLEPVSRLLAAHVPEVKAVAAHGQMPSAELDRIMQDFGQRRFDVLLSTTIIESGLDVPQANTMVVHEAHRLGLAQLYQLRGRVGRSTTQAYAWLTVPAGRDIGGTAQRRLEILQSLDTVGAGFELASHDMDLRGAGNLVGEEQSGHIREIGFDLFQTLLSRAVAALRSRDKRDWSDLWVPRLVLGTPARIPERYVPDAGRRLDLYWRLAQFETTSSIEELAREMRQEYGPQPPEVAALLGLARLRLDCRAAEIAEVIAGPRGVLLTPRPQLRIDEQVVARAARIGPARRKRDGRLALRAGSSDAAHRLALVARLVACVRDGQTSTDRRS